MQVWIESRALRWLGIGAVAVLAACIALFALNLTTPARPLAELQPTRLPTRRPPPTITPVAYPPTPPLALRDNLTSQDNFPHAQGVKLPYGYVQDSYRLAPPLDPGFVRVLDQTFNKQDYLNLTLDAEAAPAQGSGGVQYGLLFWHGEDDLGQEHFLAFTIGTDSAVRLLAFEPTTSTQKTQVAYRISDVIPKTHSADIHLDGTPNRLRVDVHPRRLLAYVNDELVIDTDAKLISEWRLQQDFDGKVGMIALASEPGADVRYTQFDIYADGKQE